MNTEWFHLDIKPNSNNLCSESVIETLNLLAIIDVRILFDEVNNIEHTKEIKINKYKDIGKVLKFNIDYLGYWFITNGNIRSI